MLVKYIEGEPEDLRYLTTEEIAAIIQRIPAGAKISANPSGNMSILSAENEYIGYIDIPHIRPLWEGRDLLTLFSEQSLDDD